MRCLPTSLAIFSKSIFFQLVALGLRLMIFEEAQLNILDFQSSAIYTLS